MQYVLFLLYNPLCKGKDLLKTTKYNNTIDEFLFSLTRCGMDSTLVVKLAPGLYKPFVMPEVQGHSQQNYIVFESLYTNNHAIFYGDATTGADYLIDLTALSDIHFRHIDFVRYEGLLTGMVKLCAETSASALCRARSRTCTSPPRWPNV